MKNTLIFALLFVNFFVFCKEGFFLQNRTGVLIKIDMESASKKNMPAQKGPTIEDLLKDISIKDFEETYLNKIKNQVDKDFILSVYGKDEEKYYIKNNFILDKLSFIVVKKNIISNLNDKEKKVFEKNYKLDKQKKFYVINSSLSDEQKLAISNQVIPYLIRVVFLEYNRENEMQTGFNNPGSPMPHKFPRVFDASSKGYFDIHFVLGYRFEDPNDPNINFTFGAGLNLTNIIMPSLELSFKHNFHLSGYAFEPYIGGVIYGGWMDGFPIGFSFMGGADLFPMDKDGNRNFYVLGEARLGIVLYSQIYFDTGKNTEGIWKKLSILAEGGIYLGAGYRFDR
ncbi:MAG: hypothetical protein A2086_15120 [Spirochaetes bacterium GWD1_27_9]|nr:MAG: hypothetical protein A2Z98_00135 [Spirochaetes bacterium GWB1_27_13]OHD24858.1 MAG: hypothetical protein A2Y34_08370 [Spirochaetes bacterium GWC1_27_15]OHD31095.1 MAG: hypothetical protein A2086_15120 [Spirochaetes bacterium GWD1_27_9]